MPSQETIDTILEADTGAEKTRMRDDEPEKGPTAKQMAAAEEANAARIQAQIRREQNMAEAKDVEEPNIVNLAAQGMDALHAALRSRAAEKPPEYTPPPRTPRQMTQLQEELEAGRRSQQRAQEQQANRPVEKSDAGKEGFTTPVYRPNNMVPDPMTGKIGAITEK